jgi:hypothetical protein
VASRRPVNVSACDLPGRLRIGQCMVRGRETGMTVDMPSHYLAIVQPDDTVSFTQAGAVEPWLEESGI